MLPIEDSRLTGDGETLVPAHDHGSEHGPGTFEGVRERLGPELVFEMATHDDT